MAVPGVELGGTEKEISLELKAGAEVTPEWVVYDRAGDATTTRNRLAHEGVKHIGMQPKGPRRLLAGSIATPNSRSG